MKAYISVDMEGMPYIVSVEQLSVKRALFSEARKIATKIVNIVSDELHKQGFDEILLADSHGSMVNIDVEQLPDYVEIIRGFPRPVSMVSFVEECDAVVFLGYHAKFGTALSTFDHTYSGSIVRKVVVNGVEVSEFLINTYVAGYYGKPVILVAGEEKLLTEDVAKYTPWAVRVPLKKSLSRYSARSPSMKKVEEMLREGVKQAVEKFREGKVKPLKTSEPVNLRVTFHSTAYADAVSLTPNSRRVDGLTVEYTARNIIEAYKLLELWVLAAYGAKQLG